MVPKIAFLVAFGVFLNLSIAHADAYDDSIKIAQSSSAAQKLLGTDIVVASDQPVPRPEDPTVEFEQWSVKLSGSLGSGNLYGVANQINETWEFSRLVLVSDDHRTADLTPPPTKLSLPAVAAQKVYLLPFGLGNGESLEWAPAYYKAKLGVRVQVMPALALDQRCVNQERKQVNAETCLDLLRGMHPELVHDPYALFVAVTSHDMYIPQFVDLYHWKYAENLRDGDRFAILSSARMRVAADITQQNPEWLNSRVQKMLTKNILSLYFSLPLSSDYTSVMSGGLLSGDEIDAMSGQVIGAEGQWDSFVNGGGPGVTIYDTPGKTSLWRMECPCNAAIDSRTQTFTSDLSYGVFMQRKADFFFGDNEPFELVRVYTSGDQISRSFGIGAMHSLDMALAGQMDYYIDLNTEEGAKARFERVKVPPGEQAPQIYRETSGGGNGFAHAVAEFSGGVWKIKRTDGWTFYFPYHPEWLSQYVTVLNAFSDPNGHRYEMERDKFGALLSVSTPGGQWLHFDNDSAHRVRKIISSTGRTVQYEYDKGGRLASVTDSEGHNDTYSYDEKGEMITVAHGKDAPVLKNSYFIDGYIKEQTLVDGRKFQYWYRHGPRNIIDQTLIVNPSGLSTFVQYDSNGFTQSLPTATPK